MVHEELVRFGEASVPRLVSLLDSALWPSAKGVLEEIGVNLADVVTEHISGLSSVDFWEARSAIEVLRSFDDSRMVDVFFSFIGSRDSFEQHVQFHGDPVDVILEDLNVNISGEALDLALKNTDDRIRRGAVWYKGYLENGGSFQKDR